MSKQKAIKKLVKKFEKQGEKVVSIKVKTTPVLALAEEEKKKIFNINTEKIIDSVNYPTDEGMRKMLNGHFPVLDSHPCMDDQEDETVKPMYDCDAPSINTPYDPDGTGKPKKNNVKLIKKVLKKTAAVHSGGVTMQVEDDRVILYSNGQLDFFAVGIFDSLGIFDVKITCDRKHRVLLVIS